MKRKLYPTDLTDKQWAMLAPLIPVAKTGGRPRRVNLRSVVNGIFACSVWWLHSRACQETGIMREE